MASLLAAPYSYFSDDNGEPLSGGKIYTYTAGGTSTPKATYTDASGSTPASNPIILDSAGRAAIWLDGTYYISVKTSGDVLVRNTDNVAATGGASSTSFNDSTFFITDDGDATKKIAFQASGITTGTTRTATMPDSSIVLVGADNVQTLTNKVIGTGCTTVTQSPGDNSTKIASTAYVDATAAARGLAKAWLMYNAVTNTILASYNIASVTDNGTGDFTINFTTPFSSANYAMAEMCNAPTATNYAVQIDTASVPTASACRVNVVNAGSGALTDIIRVSVVFFGDQ